jgi:general secretion pathway protein B
MSYILEALRRSDQERRQRRQAPAASVLRPRRRTTGRLLLAAIAVLLLVNAGLLGLWAVNRMPVPTEPGPEPVRHARPEAEGESLLARAADATATRWLEPWQIEGSGDPASAPKAADAATEAKPRPPADPGRQAENAAIESAARATRAAEPEPTPAPQPAPAPPEAPPDAPLLAELPQSLRSRLGSVDIGVHVYAEQPGNRFLILNGQRLREGKTLDNGLELVAITVDGAIFRFQEQPFRIVLR